jgi:activating signal cointegrator 1
LPLLWRSGNPCGEENMFSMRDQTRRKVELMKALSLTQPWASAIMLGYKKIETRSWYTKYRGLIAIHAAKGFPKHARDFLSNEQTWHHKERPFQYPIPRGVILGVAVITDVLNTEYLEYNISDIELLYGDYSPYRWGWLLEDIRILPEPIPCKGALGLWNVPEDVAIKIEEDIGYSLIIQKGGE